MYCFTCKTLGFTREGKRLSVKLSDLCVKPFVLRVNRCHIYKHNFLFMAKKIIYVMFTRKTLVFRRKTIH